MVRKKDRRRPDGSREPVSVKVSVRDARLFLHESIDSMDIDDLASAISETMDHYGDSIVVREADGNESCVFRKGVAVRLHSDTKGGE